MTKEKTVATLEKEKELKVHVDARDNRVRVVTDKIAAAKLVRDTDEVIGLVESDGFKLDRLAKEAKDLEEANHLYAIEPFSIDISNLAIQTLVTKVNEIIHYLNWSNGSSGVPIVHTHSVVSEPSVNSK